MRTARYGCAGASLRGQLVALGGSDGSSNLASVEAIDHRDGTWRALAPMPVALYGCAAVELLPTHFSDGHGRGEILVCGGCDSSRQMSGASFVYDAVADQWRDNSAPSSGGAPTSKPVWGHLLQPRMCHALVSVPSRCLPTATLQRLPTQPPPEEVVLALGGQSSALLHAGSLLTSVEVCASSLTGLPPIAGVTQSAPAAQTAPDNMWHPLLEWELQQPTWHHGACTVLV